jgi:hypothetical protein
MRTRLIAAITVALLAVPVASAHATPDKKCDSTKTEHQCDQGRVQHKCEEAKPQHKCEHEKG